MVLGIINIISYRYIIIYIIECPAHCFMTFELVHVLLYILLLNHPETNLNAAGRRK